MGWRLHEVINVHLGGSKDASGMLAIFEKQT